jgi:nucleotide-binding universal stress UspA family protein
VAQNVLLVADDAFDSPEAVPTCVRDLFAVGDAVTVVAPLIAGRLDIAAGDERPRREAAQRARTVVEDLTAAGMVATSKVSADGPYDAVVTELLDHTYDLIVLGTVEKGHWREKGLLDKVHAHTSIPVAEVVIGH